MRPVAEKKWLKSTGPLPLGSDPSTSQDPNYDIRSPSDGGCDSPSHFEGCHVYYMKVLELSSSTKLQLYKLIILCSSNGFDQCIVLFCFTLRRLHSGTYRTIRRHRYCLSMKYDGHIVVRKASTNISVSLYDTFAAVCFIPVCALSRVLHVPRTRVVLVCRGSHSLINPARNAYVRFHPFVTGRRHGVSMGVWPVSDGVKVLPLRGLRP